MEGRAFTAMVYILVVICLSDVAESKRCFTSIANGKTHRAYRTRDVTSGFPTSRVGLFKWVDNRVRGWPLELQYNNSELSWKNGMSGACLRNYLLMIEREVDINKTFTLSTDYFLLGPINLSTNKADFSYSCYSIKPNEYKVRFKLWSLQDVIRENNKREYRIDERFSAELVWKRPTQADRRRKEIEHCVCQAHIVRVQTFSWNEDKAIKTRTVVYNNFAVIDVKFYLNRNGETVKRWVLRTDGSKTNTTFEKDISVVPGQYQLKAKKLCFGSEEKKSHFKCEYLTRRAYGYVLSPVITLTRRTGTDVLIEPVATPLSIWFVILMSVGGGVFIASVLGIGWIIRTRQKKKRGLYGATSVTTSLIHKYTQQRGPVIVIYVNESTLHRARVYNLCTELKNGGIDTLPIDEHTRKKEFFENWIAEGEKLSNTYGNFLFVLSPSMITACRRTPCQFSPTGRNLDYMATPGGQLKLPLVILNSIKPRVLQFDVKNVQTVYFNSTSGNGEDLCMEFTASHRSILHSDTFKLDVKEIFVVKNQAFHKLLLSFSPQQNVREFQTCSRVKLVPSHMRSHV